MASAYYSKIVHIDFASVLAMENPGMVSVFNALMASGLEGFLGCPVVIYESELVDFFNNGSVRDGLVVSTVNGVPVEISEQVFAETFELPVNGLEDLSKMPKDKIFDAKSIVSLSGEPVIGAEEAAGASKPKVASKKRPAVDVGAPVAKKKRTMRKKSSYSKDNLEIVAVAQVVRVDAQLANLWRLLRTFLTNQQTDGVKVVDADVDATAEKIDEQVVEPSADVETRVGESFEPTVANIKNIEAPTADDVDSIIQQVLSETAQSESTEGKQIEELDIRGSAIGSQAAVREKHWFDLPYEDLIARWDAERPVVTASDTDEEGATMDVGAAGGDQQVQCSEEELAVMTTNDALLDADEQMSLEDILLKIPVDVPLASAGMEITRITLGKTIKIPGVDEKTKYLASLPQIPADDKGKEILVEKNLVKGNPAKEHYFLICADIDLLVNLRAQVIEAVDQSFHSFSFKKLATINIEELSRKEEQVLIWGETEITHGAGPSAWSQWTRICCSKIIEGHPRDRGAIIARTNTNTKSTCWLKTMIRVDGVWVVEPFCDQWVKIPRPVVCTEVSKQRSFVDFFPTMSEPLRILRKRWADICLEVVGFCASRRLLPVGSLHFCRSLSVVEPVFRVAPRQSPVFALRVSQFCSVFIDFSLFSWLPTADITDFLSSIALDRTVFRDVQIAQNTVSVAPSVQMLDEPSSSDSSSDDILMDFADQDTTAAANSLPAATTLDVTNALNQWRASIDQIRERDDNGAKTKDTLLLHLSNFENQVIARLYAQDRVLGALRNASNDQRNLLSLELQSSHKQLGAQIVTTGLDVVEVRRVVKETHQELNAKIHSLDEQVAATRNDLLEFSAQAQQTLSIITSH
ncbi:dystroglycan-like [Dorcoceras hygrometricum]|uniref:Dystroglycan-like n=1 Tax=Dorcoceras hygrometricum TaxID=472368 RepID=A0A2Z7B416_9LAMI|nr:dystroglycan-like [Dorcoceras hygrometricum]